MTKLISAVFKSRVGLPLLLVIENLSQLLDPLLFQTPTMNNERGKNNYALFSLLHYFMLQHGKQKVTIKSPKRTKKVVALSVAFSI